MVDELHEIHDRIIEIIDEVQQENGIEYKPLETNRMNVGLLLYLTDIASLILKKKGYKNKWLIKYRLERLALKKSERSWYLFNMLDVLKRKECIEHLKWTLTTGKYIEYPLDVKKTKVKNLILNEGDMRIEEFDSKDNLSQLINGE